MTIILQTRPLEIQSKGGFLRQSNKKKYATVQTVLGERQRAKTHLEVTTQRVVGGIYIVFECPACDKRNKQALRRAVETRKDSLTFVCNGCCRRVSVEGSAPSEPKIIVP